MKSLMKDIKKITRENLLMIVMAILVGALHFFPHGYLWFKNYPLYTPLTSDNHLSFQSYETTYAYAPWANAIFKGEWVIGDSQSFEYRNLPSPFIGESLPAILIGALAKLLNSLDLSFMIASAVFPSIAFLLVFKILTKFGVEKLSALVGSLVVIVFWDALTFLPIPSSAIYYFSNFLNWDFLPFNRSFHPQVSFVILSANILGLIYLIEKPSAKKAIICGLGTGLLFYTYVFYWTAYLFSIFLYLVYLFYKKDRLAKLIALMVAVSAVVGLPYFIEVTHFKALPLASQFSLTNSYAPFEPYPGAIKYVLIIIGLGFFGFWQSKIKKPIALLLIAASVLPILGQIIFGRDIEGDHWLSRINVPLETMCLWAFIFQKKHTKILVLLFGLTVALAFGRQFQMAEKAASAFVVDEDRKNMVAFMNVKTKKDSVVGTLSFSENAMLAVYTGNRIYIPRSDRSLVPIDENVERFLLLCKFFNISEDDLDHFFDSSGRGSMRNSDGSGVGHLFVLARVGADRKATYSTIIRQEIHEKYRKITSSNQTIRKYKIDYLLITSVEKRFSRSLEKILAKEKVVYSNSKYSIYKVVD